MVEGDIIVFSSVYGILLIFIILHIVIRWQLRRWKLRHYSQYVPGDKSFKNKRMREIITSDLQRVSQLTSDFLLCDHTLSPSSFGGEKGDEIPEHWYRMKSFDIAAEFVSCHVHVLGPTHPSPSPTTLPLPRFLSLLQQRGVISGSHDNSVLCATDLYKSARYDLRDFTQSHFQELEKHLDTLCQTISSSHPHRSFTPARSTPHTPTTPQATPTTLWHERISGKVSLEPLIQEERKTPSERQVPKISITSTTSSTSGGRRDSKGRRPMDLELSPLVIRGESHSPSPGIVISPRTGSHVPMPGTPV